MSKGIEPWQTIVKKHLKHGTGECIELATLSPTIVTLMRRRDAWFEFTKCDKCGQYHLSMGGVVLSEQAVIDQANAAKVGKQSAKQVSTVLRL